MASLVVTQSKVRATQHGGWPCDLESRDIDPVVLHGRYETEELALKEGLAVAVVALSLSQDEAADLTDFVTTTTNHPKMCLTGSVNVEYRKSGTLCVVRLERRTSRDDRYRAVPGKYTISFKVVTITVVTL